MDSYLPQNDADFNIWQKGLLTITESQLEIWGIIPEDLNKLKPFQASWDEAYAATVNKTERSSADVQGKVDARTAYEKELRKFYSAWLANNGRISNKDRERMGITVKSDTRTRVAKPATSPVGTIDFATRLQHKIHYGDQATPGRKAKPEGIHGCEIWMKIDGAAPVDESELTYVATATRSPYTKTFEGKNATKIVFYWMRWVNTRGETGPWSSLISATVPG